jgi:hypothetical protein
VASTLVLPRVSRAWTKPEMLPPMKPKLIPPVPGPLLNPVGAGRSPLAERSFKGVNPTELLKVPPLPVRASTRSSVLTAPRLTPSDCARVRSTRTMTASMSTWTGITSSLAIISSTTWRLSG